MVANLRTATSTFVRLGEKHSLDFVLLPLSRYVHEKAAADRLKRQAGAEAEEKTVQVRFHYQGFFCGSVSCRLAASHA